MGSGRKIGMGIAALVIYLIGGAATFAGGGLILFLSDRILWGWGDGRGIGYLLVCVGLSLTIAGVLLMRLFRNNPG